VGPFRILLSTVFVAVIGLWAWAVYTKLGVAPVVNSDGTIQYDEFTRAKDILALLLPLATAVAGYWFAREAKEEAQEEKREAVAAKVAAEEARAKAEEGNLRTQQALARLMPEASLEAQAEARAILGT
jgi:hypothetical protein